MIVLYGLKDIIRQGKMPVQGSKLYRAIMVRSSRLCKPKWMFKIDQRLKWRKTK